MFRNRKSRPRCRGVGALSGELCASNVALGKGYGSIEQSARIGGALGHVLFNMDGYFFEKLLEAINGDVYSEW